MLLILSNQLHALRRVRRRVGGGRVGRNGARAGLASRVHNAVELKTLAPMKHPIGCRCGTFQAHIVTSSTAVRAVCYCNDCQAYARFLRTPGVVDENGGTEVVASLPHLVHFTAGVDALACMSLSNGGVLRWVAGCCHHPGGKHPTRPNVSPLRPRHPMFQNRLP